MFAPELVLVGEGNDEVAEFDGIGGCSVEPAYTCTVSSSFGLDGSTIQKPALSSCVTAFILASTGEVGENLVWSVSPGQPADFYYSATPPDWVPEGVNILPNSGFLTQDGDGECAYPSITNFTPTSGPIGTNVTINGADLEGATSVTFNGVPAANIRRDSASKIKVVVPVEATTGPIAVTTPGGTATSTSDFTVT